MRGSGPRFMIRYTKPAAEARSCRALPGSCGSGILNNRATLPETRNPQEDPMRIRLALPGRVELVQAGAPVR